MTTEQKTQAFLSACADMIEAAVADVQRDEPRAVPYLAAAMKAGAAVQVRATLWESTGLAQAVVEVVEPNGDTHTLATLQLQR
jgi:hypothetical protein